jgi:hypothetical protein
MRRWSPASTDVSAISHREFRQIVDSVTVLETSPFGETAAVECTTHAGIAGD